MQTTHVLLLSLIGLGCLLAFLWEVRFFLGWLPDARFTLVLLPPSKGAVCLDGSPGGYYWSKGNGSNASRWVIHFEGGGWCIDVNDCAKRALTDIGSSRTWAKEMNGLPSMDGGAHGIMSNDPSKNPEFYSWSKVHVNYCDGGSFSGDVDAPVIAADGKMLYFRGRRILDAAVDSLLAMGMSTATHVIVKGCSAGGLAMYLHADYIRQKLPSQIDVVALADAGLFLDVPTWKGTPGYTPHYRHIFRMQNASALNKKCIDTQMPSEIWRCFMAQYTLPYVQTPLFLVQALYDSWQVGQILELNCAGDRCPDQRQRAAFYGLGDKMRRVLASVPNNSGIFATSCYIHGQVNLDHYWDALSVRGTTMQDAFVRWWHDRSGVQLVDDLRYGSRKC